MNGTQLLERRQFVGDSRARAAERCATTEASITATETADLKCSAAVDAVYGIIKLPRGPKTYSITSTSTIYV